MSAVAAGNYQSIRFPSLTSARISRPSVWLRR